MNFALKFYVEQFLVDLDKVEQSWMYLIGITFFSLQLLVCDIFPQIQQTLEGLNYSEYRRFYKALHRAVQAAIEVSP